MNCSSEGAKPKRQIFGVPQKLWVQETIWGRHGQDSIEKLTKMPCGDGGGAEGIHRHSLGASPQACPPPGAPVLTCAPAGNAASSRGCRKSPLLIFTKISYRPVAAPAQSHFICGLCAQKSKATIAKEAESHRNSDLDPTRKAPPHPGQGSQLVAGSPCTHPKKVSQRITVGGRITFSGCLHIPQRSGHQWPGSPGLEQTKSSDPPCFLQGSACDSGTMWKKSACRANGVSLEIYKPKKWPFLILLI